MRYLSLFSGIEAATVAWHPLGWTPVAFAEIEPGPCSVLKHHYPAVPNLGDVTRITDAQIAALGRVDVVIGGSPCQDLSVAGKRAGLAGARSSLFHEQLRIFHAARHFCGARWLVWENVPGAFSSNAGRDFAVVVGSMAGLDLAPPRDGWGNEGMAVGENGLVEWCVLDAQWFGLAQRRKRVFAVLDTGDWANRPPVLLEPDRLRGDSAPRRETGEGVAGTISARTAGGGGLGTDLDLDGGLIPETAHTLRADGFDASEDGTGRGTPLIPVGVMAHGQGGGTAEMGDDCANALRASQGGGDKPHVLTNMQVRRLTPRECSRLQGFPDDYLELNYADADEAHAAQVLHELWREAGTPALEEQGWRTGIVAALLTPEILLAGVHVGWLSWEVAARCAAARGALPGEEHNQEGFVRALRLAGEAGRSPFGRESFEQLARELGSDLPVLPLEGAQARAVLRGSRLWPEAQAKWPLRYALATGKAREKPDRLNPDGPRYKALGNSMATPVIAWIGRKIEKAAQA